MTKLERVIRQVSDLRDSVFWLEAVAVFAFGVSWLIKGETLLKDDEDQAASVRSPG